MTKITTIIGIDPGTKTGVAIKDLETGAFVLVDTFMLHKALELVGNWALPPDGLDDLPFGKKQPYMGSVAVIVEDARQRKWIEPKAGREKLQGVGSVKRDCAIWEDFLTDHGIPHKMLAPAAHRTKWPLFNWQAATGWKARTSEHARDAAILINNINLINLGLMFK